MTSTKIRAGRMMTLALSLAVPQLANAAVALTGATYSENFNGLTTSTAVVSTNGGLLPNGWQFGETGDNANSSYRAGDGSSNTGDTYSFGAAGSTDRALGSLASGSLESRFGAIFTNQTGSTINALDIAFFNEQWRNGSATVTSATATRYAFSYLVGAANLSSAGSWTTVTSLDLIDQVLTGTPSGGAVDGNTVRAQRTGTIAGLNLLQGQSIGIRWIDLDDSGSDDALAVDDFRMTASFASAVPEPSTWATMFVGLALVAGLIRRRKSRPVLA
ncbi:hypothetical protein GCM10011380_12410 [Sphingomonas metalli]|uniref:Ice-binding protein C-terminal domain-containing protein n=1 Tax=Sphingomonas metalli TaxID=1779358 RepID=A0A916SYX8_9SPHN|nr:PEPxxWA-CTERM sorting domain-containing protein [Sphingomonas metalli]GGB24376.1 hypothetical protein GCM10011380_12410 [Sphingomonas metalli]